MDGFDDLLAPSKALEQNPFADPFGRRSGSPDPWASFHQPTPSGFQDTDDGSEASASSRPIVADEALHSNAFGSDGLRDGSTSADSTARDNPLEASATTSDNHYDEVEASPVTLSPGVASPGFRESISRSPDDKFGSASQPPPREPSPPPALSPHAEPKPLSPTSPISTTPTPARTESPTPSNRVQSHSPRGSTTSLTSSTAATTSAAKHTPFYNPLDQPGGLGIDRSFAGLSLGGETLGGWQGAQATQNAWGSGSMAASEEDDDDDDKPILQARMQAQAQAAAKSATTSPATSTQQTTGQNGIHPVFAITVDDPQRVGDPIRGYIMYTVHTKTTSPLFSKSSFSVLRRYSDFLWLYETLSSNNPGVVVPPVPEKHPFGRFDTGFVERRRAALENSLKKMAAHPVLQKDSDFRFFLESDSFALDIKHRKAELAQEKGGVLASIGHSIAGPRFYETDEKTYLDSLELQLRGLVKTIDQVSKQRADLSASIAEFAQALAELSTSDVGLGPQLAKSLAGLAEVERKAEEIQKIQSTEDVRTLMSTADEYARLINSVRLAFSSRIRTYHNWQNAESNVKRAKQMHEVNRSQGRTPGQLGSTLGIVADAERRSLDAKQEFEQVSKLVKSEVARFERERIDDFKQSLEGFLDGMIKRQKELIAAWELYQQGLLKRVDQGSQKQRPRPPSLDGQALTT
ncbi:unnamed protein product [Somion occarium]|uniref:PX domain-containing protein n=1 Tax=Somion occarium TaxID=3059160 RepID=A0ABP1E4T2_9APHY